MSRGEARAGPLPRRERGEPASEEPDTPHEWRRRYALVIGLLVLEIVLLAALSARFRQ